MNFEIEFYYIYMKSFKRKQVVWAKTKGRISLNYY